MDARGAIRVACDAAWQIAMGYVGDLTDQELLVRPCAGANHINWQLGHVIFAEHAMLGKNAGVTMPPLPAGFAEKYDMPKASVDDPAQLSTKAELLAVAKQQREAFLAALAKLSDADLDRPSGVEHAPTIGALYNMLGSTHWLMHAGQWAVIRRQLGRKPLF